jgi:hypothetical protein
LGGSGRESWKKKEGDEIEHRSTARKGFPSSFAVLPEALFVVFSFYSLLSDHVASAQQEKKGRDGEASPTFSSIQFFFRLLFLHGGVIDAPSSFSSRVASSA